MHHAREPAEYRSIKLIGAFMFSVLTGDFAFKWPGSDIDQNLWAESANYK